MPKKIGQVNVPHFDPSPCQRVPSCALNSYVNSATGDFDPIKQLSFLHL